MPATEDIEWTVVANRRENQVEVELRQPDWEATRPACLKI